MKIGFVAKLRILGWVAVERRGRVWRACSASRSCSGEGDVQELVARLIVLETVGNYPQGKGLHPGDGVVLDDALDATRRGVGLQRLAKPLGIELGHDLAAIREQGELTHALQNRRGETPADLGHLVRRVPGNYVQKVVFRGLGELDAESFAHQSRPTRRFTSSSDDTRPASMSARPATTARMKSRSSCAAS